MKSLFLGGEQVDGTGLQYLRARYYDPATGRFLSKDPVPYLQRYAYVFNNPVNLVDPSGLSALGERLRSLAQELAGCALEHALDGDIGACREALNALLDASAALEAAWQDWEAVVEEVYDEILVPYMNAREWLIGFVKNDWKQFRDDFSRLPERSKLRWNQFEDAADALDDWLNDRSPDCYAYTFLAMAIIGMAIIQPETVAAAAAGLQQLQEPIATACFTE